MCMRSVCRPAVAAWRSFSTASAACSSLKSATTAQLSRTFVAILPISGAIFFSAVDESLHQAEVLIFSSETANVFARDRLEQNSVWRRFDDRAGTVLNFKFSPDSSRDHDLP